MSAKKENEIRWKTDAAESALIERGLYHLPNDEPGFAASVAEALRRRYPASDLKVETQLRGFGGEYVFRSASRLGAKSDEGSEPRQ